MSDVAQPSPAISKPTTDLPVFTRKATGLVREIPMMDQVLFNAAATNPLGAALVFGLFTLILFPRSNFYVGIGIALFLGLFVWVTFALMTAAIPRIGGDYTFNSRILHPAVGLFGNVCAFISSCIAAGLWAWWMADQGLAPIFTVIGETTGSSTITSWGTWFAGDGNHRWQTFMVAVLALALTSALAIMGTKVILRTMAILFLIAIVGFVVDMLILLFTSHDSFRHTVDSVAGAGTYQKTVNAGAKAGLFPTNGYSGRSTLGAIYYTLTVTIWVWWGTYIAAEFKGAGVRKRQMQSMIGAGLGQGLLLMLAAFIFLNSVGYNFFVSALAGNYTAGGGAVGTAGYAYFSALVANNSAVVTILALTFLCWWLPGLYINSAMAQRALFTWSFDGLLPKKLGEVNERTHTPVIAIGVVFVLSCLGALWVAFSSNFFTVFSIMVLFAYFPIVLVGFSAIVMRSRRPDLYDGSPADWRPGGIPVLPIAGIGCLFTGVFAIFLALHFHTELGIFDSSAIFGLSYFQMAFIAPVLVLVGSLIWYAAARGVRKNEGIDMALAYKAIPPD
jgi:amino acid transporter